MKCNNTSTQPALIRNKNWLQKRLSYFGGSSHQMRKIPISIKNIYIKQEQVSVDKLSVGIGQSSMVAAVLI